MKVGEFHMMEHVTDRLFWTLSVVIIAGLLSVVVVKAFPNLMTNAMYTTSRITDVTRTGGLFQNDTAKTHWLAPDPSANGADLVTSDPNTINSLKAQIQKLTNDSSNKDQTHDDLQTTIQKVYQRNNDLNALLNQSASAASNGNNTPENVIKNIQAGNQDLYNQIQQAATDAQNKYNDYQNKINQANQQITDLTNQLTQAQQAANNGQSTGEASSQNQISSLTNQITDLQSQINDYQNQANQTGIDLQNQLNDAEAKYENYQNQLGLNQQTIDNLNKAQQNLYNELSKLADGAWNSLTPDQQNSLMSQYYDQLSWQVKDSWAPSHFNQLTPAQQIAYAKHNSAALTPAQLDLVAQDSAVDPSINNLIAQDNGDGTATITGHGATLNPNLVIPSYVLMNGHILKVTTIGKQAFQAAPITSLTLPDTVTTLDDLAFYETSAAQNYGLVSIHFGTNLQTIGSNCFANTNTLTTINTLPASIQSIPNGAFANTNIKQIVLSKNTQVNIGLAFWGVPNTNSIVTYY